VRRRIDGLDLIGVLKREGVDMSRESAVLKEESET
jgi:hypothetical protein